MTSSQHASYVRTEMLPESPPPLTESGIVKWVKENLFSGWINSLLTVVSLYVIYVCLSHIIPWVFQSVWNAGSLTECREIAQEAYGHTHGACWAVIKERWHQLLFGFYPQDLYWRPILAFLLMFVALAPILFDRVPRKLLFFTAIYPFLMIWLCWGGSIWGPVCAALGFVIGYFTLITLEKVAGSLIAIIGMFVVPVMWWLYLSGPVSEMLTSTLPIGLQAVGSKDIGGFMLSFIIGLSGIALSFPIGLLLALGRQSNLFIVKSICVGFIEFIRGVPLITLLFVASLLLGYFLPKEVTFDLIVRVIILVTLFAAAYMAEVIRGGLAALPRGQYEAADALGLDYWKSMRLIILPQALKISIPGIVSTFIGLFKDTVLVVFVGLQDPIGFSNLIRAATEWNGIYWELFVFIGACFFVCCFSMSRYSMYLERKLQTDHR